LFASYTLEYLQLYKYLLVEDTYKDFQTRRSDAHRRVTHHQ